MVYSIQRDEGAQALENHLNVIDSKKSLRIEYLAKQLKSCDAKLKGLEYGSQLHFLNHTAHGHHLKGR